RGNGAGPPDQDGDVGVPLSLDLEVVVAAVAGGQPGIVNDQVCCMPERTVAQGMGPAVVAHLIGTAAHVDPVTGVSQPLSHDVEHVAWPLCDQDCLGGFHVSSSCS